MFNIEVTNENGSIVIDVNRKKYKPGDCIIWEGNQICVTFDEKKTPVLEVFNQTKQMYINCPGAEIFTPALGLKMIYGLDYWVNIWKQMG